MWESIKLKLRGWKTMIWSTFLVVLGIVCTVLASLNVDMVSLLLPEKYRPLAPLILVVIGAVTGSLRLITTGPVGEKGTEEPEPGVKAGD